MQILNPGAAWQHVDWIMTNEDWDHPLLAVADRRQPHRLGDPDAAPKKFPGWGLTFNCHLILPLVVAPTHVRHGAKDPRQLDAGTPQ